MFLKRTFEGILTKIINAIELKELPKYPKTIAKMFDKTSFLWSLVIASTDGVLTLLQTRKRMIFVPAIGNRKHITLG